MFVPKMVLDSETVKVQTKEKDQICNCYTNNFTEIVLHINRNGESANKREKLKNCFHQGWLSTFAKYPLQSLIFLHLVQFEYPYHLKKKQIKQLQIYNKFEEGNLKTKEKRQGHNCFHQYPFQHLQQQIFSPQVFTPKTINIFTSFKKILTQISEMIIHKNYAFPS